MSQENVQTVLDMAAAFNRGDIDAWVEYWTDDLDYRPVGGAADDPGPIHGKKAFVAYVEDWRDTFEGFRVDPVEVIDGGDDTVVAVVKASGRARLSGVETEVPYAIAYTARDGKIARGREYWTRQEALAAVGLSE